MIAFRSHKQRLSKNLQVAFVKGRNKRNSSASTCRNIRLCCKRPYEKAFKMFVTIIFVTVINFFLAARNDSVQKVMYIYIPLLHNNYSSFQQQDDLKCLPSSYMINENVSTYQILWIGCNMPYTDRLILFNRVLELNSKIMLDNDKVNVAWPKRRVSLTYTDSASHLKMTQVQHSMSYITTLFLDYLGPPFDSNWTFKHPLTRSSYIESNFYDWEALYPVCEWLRRFVNYTGDRQCFESSLSLNNALVYTCVYIYKAISCIYQSLN